MLIVLTHIHTPTHVHKAKGHKKIQEDDEYVYYLDFGDGHMDIQMCPKLSNYITKYVFSFSW